LIEVLGRPVPVINTDDGIRAAQKGKPIDPDGVRRYLENKFGDNLKAVKSAMQKLAKAYKPE
jgi:DNA polymerase III delta subunit